MGHIRKIEKQTENRFLNMYHLEFEDRAGNDRDYYFCTRNSDDKLKIRTHSLETEGICIYAITREENPRLVLVKEYRFPIDDDVYALPAGLTDPGETAGEAAVREMREETGFRFVEYKGGEAFYRRPFFLAPGFSDEPGTAVFGFAEDLQGNPESESTEWIQPILADKAEVRRILSQEKVSVRGAFLMFQFLQMDPGNPFAFLNGGV
ncbi:MAG: NUDIX hydrolase [Lachnospiraceae bacterium]|nr:NUDIX hydrolase [Lachnospiraceae bacterium]